MVRGRAGLVLHAYMEIISKWILSLSLTKVYGDDSESYRNNLQRSEQKKERQNSLALYIFFN